MSFNFNTAGELVVNLEIAMTATGSVLTSPPWILKDIDYSYTRTYKYTTDNRYLLSIYTDVNQHNTKYLEPCDIGSYINKPEISSFQDISGGYVISNPAFSDEYVYFAAADGQMYEYQIIGNPPSLVGSKSYKVETFGIDYAICMGSSDQHIVYIESPDVSPTNSYKLKYYDKSSNNSFDIEDYGSSGSTSSANRTLFRKEKLVSFNHVDIGFIICYITDFYGSGATFSNSRLCIYNSSYSKLFDIDINAELDSIFGSTSSTAFNGCYMRVSPNKKDLALFRRFSGKVGKVSIDSGGCKFSFVTGPGEVNDLDFGYGYGLSPSNIYILDVINNYSFWNVEKDKAGIGTWLDIFSFSNFDPPGVSQYPLEYILTDSRNDPSETGYLFFGDGFVGTSSLYRGSAGSMTNMYFAVTYSTATWSQIQGPLVGYTASNVGDYTLGINCMAVVDGSEASNAPKGHILQYYNVGNQLRVFNTSAGKVSETVSETSVSLSSSSTNYNLVKFREDDVYLLVNQDKGEFQFIYWG